MNTATVEIAGATLLSLCLQNATLPFGGTLLYDRNLIPASPCVNVWQIAADFPSCNLNNNQ